MQTKVYFASSIPAALEVARQDLGDEAMLVQARPAPPEVRQYGRLEVTFAWDPPGSQMNAARQQPASLRAAIGSQAPTQPAEDNWISEKLTSCGFSRDLAADLASAAETADNPGEAVVRELARRIPTASSIESRTIAFIGPPGRGKTTSLVKIAMNFGLLRHVPVRVYTAGEHGIGAREQMARFAGIMGIPWQSFESLAALSLALTGDTWKGLVLIDTPGISPAEGDVLNDLGRFFSAKPEIETHLVLRSEGTSADMLRVIARFSGLKPARLLFTGVDEASSVAPMVETLLRCGVPASFAGTGQQIPEDLVQPSAESLARSVWTGDTSPLTMDGTRFTLAAA